MQKNNLFKKNALFSRITLKEFCFIFVNYTKPFMLILEKHKTCMKRRKCKLDKLEKTEMSLKSKYNCF